MNLLQQTKLLLKQYKTFPKRRLSQNFIVNSDVLQRLVSYAPLSRESTVLEIGAGLGFLTKILARKCRKVIAVEIDPLLYNILVKELGEFNNIDLVLGDILKISVAPFDQVISIPPYHISSKILFWLLRKPIKCAVLILQKEFADRLVAEVGSDDYGKLTVYTYYKAYVELLETVSRKEFYPQPNVDSVIVRLRPKESKPFVIHNEQVFTDLLQVMFTQRNKRARNALIPYFIKHGYAKEDAKKLVNTCISSSKRVRELAPEDFGEIANVLS
jgi:16S rRNA (adenine1518-N6/adenine1519-N6)-dimethyltransferase